MKSELLALLLSSVDVSKFAKGVLHLAEKEAQAAAAKTATPIDDAIEAVAFPALNPAVEAFIDAEVAKLQALVAAV